jgi:hypothetical protein
VTLKELVATTGVWADLADKDGRKQTVTTDQLTVRTAVDADGKQYPGWSRPPATPTRSTTSRTCGRATSS